MKLTFKRDDAVRLLDRTASVVRRGGSIPILNHLLLQASNKGLRVTGSNLEMEASATIRADVSKDGAFAVPAERFATIVKNLGAGAEIAMKLDGPQLAVSSGRSHYKLPKLSADDFPHLEALGLPDPVQTTTRYLSDLLRKASEAACQDEARPAFCGVHLISDGPAFSAVATNGRMLSVLCVEGEPGIEAFPAKTVPNAVVSAMLRVLTDGEIAHVAWNHHLIRLVAGGVTLVAKLIDYPFTAYKSMIPADYEPPLTLNAADFRLALTRIAPFADDNDPVVALEYGPEGCSLAAASTIAGAAAHEGIDGQWSGEHRRILTGAKGLKHALNAIDGETFEVHRHLSDNIHVLRLSDPSERGLTIILTTMRGK